MSIDISYHAFSPSKADEQWVNFAEDVLVLREKHKNYLAHREVQEKNTELRKEAYKTKYEPILKKKMKELFKLYEAEGLYIPGVDWHQDGPVMVDGRWGSYHPTDEEKMEYLLQYGPMFPKGLAKGGPVPGKFMYVEDKEEYQKLKEEVEAHRWDEVPNSVPEVEMAQVALTGRQAEMEKRGGIDYLAYEHEFDKNRLLGDLKLIDLHYGGIEPDLPESPAFFEPVLEAFGLKKLLEDAAFISYGELIADKNKWFDIYDSLSSEIIHERAMVMAKETGWEVGECEGYIRDFFMGMKPLMKFLKNNPDAFLTRYLYSEGIFEPKEAESFMTKRAEEKAEKYKGLIPPVL
jgi:hypothetical protein